MIHFVRSENIDVSKWDHCVQHAINENVFGYSWYLNAICKKWDAFILNDYEAVFPLPTKSKLGFRILYQPFFSRLFTIYSSKKISSETQQSFFSAIRKRFHRVLLGYRFIEDFKPKGFKHEIFPYQFLNLNQPFEILQSNYSDNARRLIKKAKKAELMVKPIAPEWIVKMFEETKGAKIKELKEDDFQHLKNLMLACLNHKKGISIGAFNQNQELCASAFFIIHGETLFYLKGAANEFGRKHGGMHFLFDDVIEKYSNQTMVLDFGGSKIESIAGFYKKFGAIDQYYSFLSKNLLKPYS